MKRLLMYVVCGIVCALFLMPATEARASELVFNFINPSFGGSPFNGSWMLAQAQAQNKHVEKRKPFTMPKRDPMQDFENSLNRQILNRLSQKIVDSAFGEQGLDPGQYIIGDYTIDVMVDVISGIKVTITDTATGNTTTVKIPYY